MGNIDRDNEAWSGGARGGGGGQGTKKRKGNKVLT